MKNSPSKIIVDDETFDSLQAIATAETNNPARLLEIAGIDGKMLEKFARGTRRTQDKSIQKLVVAAKQNEARKSLRVFLETASESDRKKFVSVLLKGLEQIVGVSAGLAPKQHKHRFGKKSPYVLVTLPQKFSNSQKAKSELKGAFIKSLSSFSFQKPIVIDVDGKKVSFGRTKVSGAKIIESVNKLLVNV